VRTARTTSTGAGAVRNRTTRKAEKTNVRAPSADLVVQSDPAPNASRTLQAADRHAAVDSLLRTFHIGVEGERLIDGVAFFEQVVIPRIKELHAQGIRCAVVFDLDNTLFDTRYRTREAAKAFGKKYGITRLAKAPLSKIGNDGADTCARLGIKDPKIVAAFQDFWLSFFWNQDNFHFDKPIKNVAKLLHDAKDAGAEIFYLTGRINDLRPGTRTQIESLPDGDDAHLIHKPGLGIHTPEFKTDQLANGLYEKEDPLVVVAFISEGRRDIRHIQANVEGIEVLLYEFPIDREGNQVQDGTPAIPYKS
jgi:hypothetical protein